MITFQTDSSQSGNTFRESEVRPVRCFRRRKKRVKTLVLAGLAVFLSCSFHACNQDGDYKQIDFKKKIGAASPEVKNSDGKMLRVAIAAMISPKETFIYYRELIDYLGAKIGFDVELIQRKTYGEVNELLANGRIDLAFICTGPYVSSTRSNRFQAIATPVVRGQPFYQSYLIVHRNSEVRSLADLAQKDFAFTDPDSNTGALVPQFWLRQMGVQPEKFFRSFTYTYSHDNSIMAVAKKLVDGAAVDGHMWEYYQQRNPFYSSQTRVIKKSILFGSPPIVVSSALSDSAKSELTALIMSMHEDPEGRRILAELMIDRFIPPRTEWYEPVKDMLDQISAEKSADDVSQKS